ncbi:MAG: hypothetical protein GY716_04520 [bacterium]|nr:hypothetical protein [bacterium]
MACISLRLILLAVLGMLAAPGFGQATDHPPRLRVLSYNIHHGRGTDGVFDYERLARIINDLEPDLVALQEVDRGVRRSGGVDQAPILAELTGMHSAFGNALYHQGGEYGEAILSRFPLHRIRAHHLPFRADLEPRTALAARVDPGPGLPDLVFVGTHLCHQQQDTRTEQTKRLHALFSSGDTPVIMAGDFNARPGSDPMNVLLEDGWVDAVAPRSRIDYVLHRERDPWHVAEVRIVDEPVASDHDPVLVVLEWRPTEHIRTIDLPAEHAIPETVDCSGSFTFRMCVRMDAAPGDLPTLAANKAWSDGEIRDYTTNNEFGIGRESGTTRGFAISVLPDGAWTWNAGDGKSRVDHRPEAADQGIADGRWHEIGFACDQEHGVAHLFHDGRRVAIHDLRQVRDLGAEAAVQLGSDGADLEIGEVRLEPGVLSREDAARQFARRFGEHRRPITPPTWDGEPLRVLAWNIWHGGRRKGRDEGVQRVVDVIRQCDADIVLMQETYGSGPRISGRLGFEYFLRSSNLSVMSRYPIVDVHRLGPAFRFGGVTVELRAGVRVQAYSLWIDYRPSVGKQLTEEATTGQPEAADARTRGRDMQGILEVLLPHLARAPNTPVIVGGDFNSGSHLDWTHAARGLPNHHGRVVTWPVSKMMHDAGFADAFRVAHPDPVADPGLTWSPEFRDSHQDRIDYVYVRGHQWKVEDAAVLSEHVDGWPSDHGAVLATLRLELERATP